MALRLLVADDNAATRKMIQLAFAGEDALVETVAGGYGALRVLSEFCPDAVLADVSMPDISGYDLCERIRRNPKFTAVPVILLSGILDSFDDEKAALVEASGRLTKPFDPAEMIALVERLLSETVQRTASGSHGNKPGNKKDALFVKTDILHVSPRVLESYICPNRILEIFGCETFSRKAGSDSRLSDMLIEQLAERVAEKIFPEIEAIVCRTIRNGNI